MPAEEKAPVRLAMWSGPRNISTALMRAFENRPDTRVVDEPFYGYYLQASGSQHPGREQIIAAMDCDWRGVAGQLAYAPFDRSVYYQKHMTHHMLPEVDLSFTRALVNCFLLRDPGRIILSYAKVRPELTLEDIGLPQQLAIFRYVRDHGGQPLVLDAAEVLANPRAALMRLCAHAAIAFTDAMLAWPPGPRVSDGVWASHWYAAVEASTGFQPPERDEVRVPHQYAHIHEQALKIYRELKEAESNSLVAR